MLHALKTWPEFYKEIVDGSKKFEIRLNDRPFKVGDEVVLQALGEQDGFGLGGHR